MVDNDGVTTETFDSPSINGAPEDTGTYLIYFSKKDPRNLWPALFRLHLPVFSGDLFVHQTQAGLHISTNQELNK